MLGSDELLGYGTFPGLMIESSEQDGVVFGMNHFGNTEAIEPDYNLGRTATHEIGHWLDVYHTFKGGCVNNDCLLDGDYVCDTPPVKVKTIGCPFGNNTCQTDVNSGFPQDQNDLIENYMDYSRDICFNMFTQGQAERMQTTLAGIRSSILNSNGCDAINPPPPPPSNHCFNFVQDADETGINCGGADCPPCSNDENICSGIPDGDCTDCALRELDQYIYGCLKGADDGDFRYMYAAYYYIGTSNFHYDGGRIYIKADNDPTYNDANDGGTNCHKAPGFIQLEQGFAFSANANNEIKMDLCNLPNYYEDNIKECHKNTADPCPKEKDRNDRKTNIQDTTNNQDTINNNSYFTDESSTADQSTTNNFINIYPNPAADNFHINYSVANLADVIIVIENIYGQKIEQFYFQKQAGIHNLKYEGTKLVAGIYFVTIHAGEYTETQKIVKVR